MTKPITMVCFVIVGGGLLALTAGTPPAMPAVKPLAPGAPPGAAAEANARTGGYWILLDSNRDGETRPYSVRPDGSRLTPLFPATGNAAYARAVSRLGGTIALELDEELFVARTNGTRLRRLVRRAWSVALSADGKRLAFTYGSPTRMFVIGIDGRGRRRLTSGDDYELDWSPDGKALVFSDQSRLSRLAIVVQPLHGKRHVLVRGPGVVTPKWSPDGSWIAYIGPGGLFLVRPSGAGRHLLARGSIESFAWSPDGRSLAFGAGEKVFTVGRDGGAPRRLRLRGLRKIAALSWSPDGRLLALESAGIWVVGRDGRGLRRVAHEGSNTLVGWSRLAPVLPPASPLLPSEKVLGATTVATRTPIADLSADGSRVGLIVGWTGADCDHVVIWTPAARALNRFRKPSTSCPEGVSDLELAGSRAAWATVSGCGNFCDVKLESATLDNPAPVWVLNDTISHGEQPDYSLRGDGDLLVFNFGARLVRIGTGSEQCGGNGTGRICATLRSGAHASPADSVSGGLIAVREPDAVTVLDNRGALVNVFPFAPNEVKAARVDGGRLVVARSGLLEVYDVATGAAQLQRPLPAGYSFTDVDGGIAVLRHANTIMLLGLSDGRSLTLAPSRGPVLADLEPVGLYYSYATADGGGRAVLVPQSELLQQLGGAQ
jgi:hypothetical protein